MEVAPGVPWLRMPLPAALNHINLWLLEDGDGWTAVDCGFANDETRGLWARHFAETMDGRPLKRVIVTHFHPDHSGLCGWLCEQHAAPLWISRTEWLMHKMLMFDDDARNSGFQADFYRLNGLDPDLTRKMQSRGNAYKWVSVEAPHSCPPGWPTGTFSTLEATNGGSWSAPAHTPEHVSLYCADLGRAHLGRSDPAAHHRPNITLPGSQPTTNPLDDYLTSLERFRGLMPDETLVLPSHIVPFRGLHRRIDQLAGHHAERLKEILDAVDRPMTAAELLPVLFGTGRDFDLFEQGFAMGEALAHLAYLEKRGELAVAHHDDGLIRYAPAGPAG